MTYDDIGLYDFLVDTLKMTIEARMKRKQVFLSTHIVDLVKLICFVMGIRIDSQSKEDLTS